jgi:hypothetical protein
VSFQNMNPQLVAALQGLFAAAPGRVWITSGWRSPEKQKQLWHAALEKYGDPEVADNWVARPGSSHHESGDAGDLGFENADVREWVHANASRFGLRFPMSHEPWHIEMAGRRSTADRGAYTNNPNTGANPVDEFADELGADDPYDPGAQARRLFELISAGPDTSIAASPKAEITGQPALSQELVTP